MRKMILGFPVAIMLMATSAQAQGAVWSATFTPGDINGYAFGCRNGDDDAECSNKDVLSDDTFTVGEIVYTVTEFYQTSGTNRLYFAGIRTPEDGTSWVDIADELKIGSTSLDIGYAFLSQGQNSTSAWRLRWSGDRGLDDVLGGDSLTDGTSISVTLISGDLPPPPPPPTTPGAPTGLAATANGPSQIDLAWTAPASTGGSAITGYKIEVSPDGSSWSDLVADTGSTDTAYAHMGLDPATTRHYRVSAINAVGTSNASDSDDTTTASTNTAPTGAPTITGTAEVGETLTAVTTGIADADGLTRVSYTYQWIRVDGTEADIAAANSSTYTLGDADLGTTLKVKVTFDDDLGHTETLTSAATATVGAVATAPTVSTVDVTSMPASGDTYGTGEMIQFTVTFDQDVTVTGTPEFEFCLGNSDGGSCTDGSPPPTRRRAALSSGSGTMALVFSYTVVAGDMDDNGIWIGDQDRTIKLDTGDAIRGTVGGLDAVLTHPSGGAQTGHKVNGEATDRAALVALYNATSGPNWTINTNWLTTAALSEWYGVTTDVDGRVTHVYLAQNELNGELPVELGDLTNLQILYLNQNMLSGAIPVALGKLTNLEQLSLSQNMLSGEIPAALGDLTNLQSLSLSANTLSGKIPAKLGNLTNLEDLFLNRNELSGPLPLTLSALSQLSVLDIRETTLCAPVNTAFQAWLATIDFQGAVCAPPPPPPPPPPGPRRTVPDAPRNLLADATDGAVTLMWEAPEDDGGAVITDYEYRIDQRGDWISIGSTATTHTVTGLVNGTTYVFQVRALNRIGRSGPSLPAEATPIAQVVLDLAHFANGASIISEVVLVNVAPHPIRPALYFYDQEGEPIAAESMVDVLGDLGIQEDGGLTIRTEMEPLGELTISTHGRGDLVSGSVKVAAYGAIGGVLRFDLLGIGVAGVQVSQPLRDAIFPVRRREGGIDTGMALHNREEEAAVVSCRLMKNGAVLEEVEITLAANGQVARFIGEVFTGTDTSDFVGLVRCTAEGVAQFTGMALELDAGNRIFTTLPVVKVNRGRAGEAALDFAHFANGASIVSEMVFMNLETQPSGPPLSPFHQAIPPTRPVIYFYDQEGNPIDPALLVDLTGDLEITEDGALSIQSEMEPLGELTISTYGRGELVSGSVRVVSDGPIGGVLRFDLPGIGVAGVGASQPVRDAIFPARRQAGGISTGAAIHNLGEEALVVGCQLMKDGAVLEEEEISLEANGQEARYIEEMFTSTDTSDFVGSVRCTAPPGEGMFTGVAVELDAGNRIFTTLPVVPVPERMSQE